MVSVQVLVAERGPLVLVANFTPDQDFEDLKVTLRPGLP